MSVLQTSNIWLNAIGNTRIGAEGSDVRLVGSNNTIKLTSDLNISRNVNVSGAVVSRRSGTEIIDLVVTDNSDNLVLTDVSPYAAVHSIVYITPSKSLKITGIDSSTFEYGKTITIKNKTRTIHSNSALILFEHQSGSSSSNNKINFKDDLYPIFLMPEDNIKISKFRLPTGETEWRCVGGNRNMGGSRRARFDQHFSPNLKPEDIFSGTSSLYDRNQDTSYMTVQGENVQFQAHELTLGSTASSYVDIGDPGASGVIGDRSIFQFARITVDRIPTISEDFIIYFGILGYTDVWINGVPKDMIGWAMDLNHSTTALVTKTINSNSTTISTTSIGIQNNEWYSLGMFINGDGTRADFFYSLDNCKTWNFIEPHTSNLPLTTVGLGPHITVYRVAGTGLRYVYITTWGIVGTLR